MGNFTRIASEALWLVLLLSLLPLLASLVVGLVTGLLQGLTQIQEQSLTFVPKVFATILVLILALAWMMTTLVEFTKRLFDLMLQVGKMN